MSSIFGECAPVCAAAARGEDEAAAGVVKAKEADEGTGTAVVGGTLALPTPNKGK
jgi:hypothetical protein